MTHNSQILQYIHSAVCLYKRYIASLKNSIICFIFPLLLIYLANVHNTIKLGSIKMGSCHFSSLHPGVNARARDPISPLLSNTPLKTVKARSVGVSNLDSLIYYANFNFRLGARLICLKNRCFQFGRYLTLKFPYKKGFAIQGDIAACFQNKCRDKASGLLKRNKLHSVCGLLFDNNKVRCERRCAMCGTVSAKKVMQFIHSVELIEHLCSADMQCY